MPNAPPPIRVVVKLPYNRPEEAQPNPPRVEWNPEKEQILWEVIAKSRAVEGAGTDWKGLAAHLQVPLPYLLFRAQTRYEEDLRGLQGIRGAFSPTISSPTSLVPPSPSAGGFAVPASLATKPNSATGEYFPQLPTPVSAGPRKEFPRLGIANGAMSSSTTGRPMNVRARLSSLSHSSRTRKASTMSQQSKQVLGSSVLTLQGPKRSREHIQRLSPTVSSRASPSAVSSNDASSEDENDKAEEEERRAEEQEALELKLKNLQKMITRETLGLIASPSPVSPSRSQILSMSIKGKEVDRGRRRPLSASSASVNFAGLDITRRHSSSQTPSHHSLSSASSPQGSIPSIPSPPPERRGQPQSPMARRLSEQFKSTSPPTVSTRPAWAQATRAGTVGRTRIGGGRSERGSEMGSEASSFSDLSDASLSASALESALMSNVRGGSRYLLSSHLSQRHWYNNSTTMKLTFVTDLGQSFVVEIDPDMELENVMALLEAESGIPISEQSIHHEGREMSNPKATMKESGVADQAMLLLRKKVNIAGVTMEQDPEMMRLQILGDPELVRQLQATNPEIIEAAKHNPARFAELLRETRQRQMEAEAEIAKLEADPFDIESQRRIEEAIRQQAVMENLDHAMEYSPESFGRVTMLYIPVEVNGHPVKAFVDSGAQSTIMSPECAEACGIMRLIDKRFGGIARGVGTARILGRVHSAQLKLADIHLACSFTIMEGRDVDLLFGLDMLKAHLACIDLEKNVLRIQGREVKFLAEHELPDKARQFESGEGDSSQAGPSGSTSASQPPNPPSHFPGSGNTIGGAPANTPPTAPRPQAQPSFPEAAVTTLMGLGATRELAISSLEAAGGNVDVAASFLFQ
ncbi:DNA damage-inducible protein 1 [Steccherinum ochraceum]|uniref:DNA damage-inducible protein 1 n=1 Tax=Steccherinum ochraceum TaxID=92696 RepID=A0A4R0R2S8_9APHY|nr:DNA damage-inducible protein 1 [Steccherinum ochraceum]